MLSAGLKFKLDAKGRITKRKVELLAADAREEGDGKQPRSRQGRRRSARRLLRRHLPPRRARAAPQGSRAQRHHRHPRHPRRRGDRQRRLCLAAAQDQRGVPHRHAEDAPRRSSTRPWPRPRHTACRAPRRSPCSPRPRICSTTWRELGRPTPELRYQKAWMLIQFARNYAVLGDTRQMEGASAGGAASFSQGCSTRRPDEVRYQSDLLTGRERGRRRG